MLKSSLLYRMQYSLWCCMLCCWSSISYANEVQPFQGVSKGWYFNIYQKGTDVIVNFKGPFTSENICFTKASAHSVSPQCYERETVEYLKWRTQTTKAWVLPVKTGTESQHLLFRTKESCYQVLEDEFYYTSGHVKTRLSGDIRYCLLTDVNFEEYYQPYRWMKDHRNSKPSIPKKYKAWTLTTEAGRYVMTLQFPGKGDLAQQSCSLVAQQGYYYSFLPNRMGFQQKVKRMIKTPNKTCEYRQPKAHEVPLIYTHIEEHLNDQKDKKPAAKQPKAEKSAWLLVIKKRGKPFPIYLNQRKDCDQLIHDAYYYAEISRGGLFPSKSVRVDFTEAQRCRKVMVPEGQKLYPFIEKH